MHAVPGGPYSNERNLPPEIEENFKERYQLNLPIYEQYGTSCETSMKGDLGPSQRLLDFSVNRGDCARTARVGVPGYSGAVIRGHIRT